MAKGSSTAQINISGAGPRDVTVAVNLFNPAEPNRNELQGFVEADGYVSIEAEHYAKKVDAGAARWEKLKITAAPFLR